MSHDDTNVRGGETNPTSSRAATFAETVRPPTPSSSLNSPLPDYPKKCDIIFHDESLLGGMNLHVSSNSHDSLIFFIPRKVSNDIPIGRILMDTYDLTSCATEQLLHHISFEVNAADPNNYSTMIKQGLAVKGIVYSPTISSPPGFQAIKVNFRRIPQHYKLDDILRLFSSYGKSLRIGMYYRDHPNRKIYTQEGYVLFEVVDGLSRLDLPREIKVGPGAPVILNTVGAPSIKSSSTTTRPNNGNNNDNQYAHKAPAAKNVQKQDGEGFQLVQRKKRTGNKRVKSNNTPITLMEGVEPTSTPVPAVQAIPPTQPAHVA
ncbi:hypothetical protein BGW39_002601 [Mortierella sp. 14UC]|nr:hypothetical protein BGW39_002601 [Mortierella sp. 14UC]